MKQVKLIVCIICLGFFSGIRGQESWLEDYIQYGLENNLALRQKQANFDKSLQALKSASALFYPNLSIDARYTVARGGRIIDFPVGDLLNPVYSSLNQLLQTDQFPQLENEEFPFYRPQEHETKLTLVQPVFNPKIIYNYQVERGMTNAAKTDIDIYKRELILEIKTAYYNYLKTVYLQQLVDESLVLLEENLRVSKSLFENDKVTSDVVYRSEAELQKVLQEKAEAEKANQTAKAYFNFLLNKSLDEEIQVQEYEINTELTQITSLDNQISYGIDMREELLQLETYQQISKNYLKLARSSNYPNIFLAVNYGFQGEEYIFTAEDDFMLASVVLQWNLFQGFKNRADVQQAKIASHQLELKQLEAQKQIELQIISAYYEMLSAAKAIEASRAQVEASEKAFMIVNEKYRNGQVQLIEFNDAETALSSSKQNLIIAYFDYKIKEADFERATASISLQ